MASYEEIFASKLDWAMPFQRTGAFPIDRSSMFDSYEDALAYARQDGSDLRKLGGTSYIGQIVTVYGKDAGTVTEEGGTVYKTEVAAYIITGVGVEGASLQKLAQTATTGDFAADIANLQAALSAMGSRISTLENKVDNFEDTDTTYSFTTGVDTDGAIKITTKLTDGSETSSEVQIKGWNTLVAIANGRTTSYVYQNKSSEDYLIDIRTPNKFKLGDLIYFRDNDISDQWVSTILDSADAEGRWYLFTNSETDHPDLSGYLTIADANNKYATIDSVSLKADITTVNNLANTIANNKTDTDNNIDTINSKLGSVKTDSEGRIISLQTQINNIDVSSQIDAKINDLDVAIVGGTTNSYISSIKQVDGKIEATAATLPDYSNIYEAKGAAQNALNDAKSYADGILVEAKEYTDTEINKVSSSISNVQSSVGSLNKVVQEHTSKISTIESTINAHSTKISNIEKAISSNASSINNITTRVETLENKINKGVVSDIKVGGVKLEKDSEGAVNINSISTDLLTQGTQLLILDCLNASLTNN